jgi:hypothetical protein
MDILVHIISGILVLTILHGGFVRISMDVERKAGMKW